MIFAQIKDNIVQNVIILDDTDLVNTFKVGYDYCNRIDNLVIKPGIFWTYDPGTNTYTRPEPPEE